MFNQNTSASRSGTSRRIRTGRTDFGYRLAMAGLLVGLAAATPWLQLSFQGNDPFSQLLALARTVGAPYLLLGAAVLAGLAAVLGSVVVLATIVLKRSSARPPRASAENRVGRAAVTH